MGWFDSLFQPISRSKFAKLIARELRSVGDKRSSQFIPEAFQLRFMQGSKYVGVANLHNLYAEYSYRSGRERTKYLKQAVRSLLSTYKKLPTEFSDARPDLFPTVRERSYFTNLETRIWANGDGAFTWPHLPLGQHLAIGLVYDLPESMVMLQQDQLDSWDVSFYEAYEAAFANLAGCEVTFASYDDRLYVADTQDNYDATRMLLTDVIRNLSIQGNPIVMVPNRDKLLVTGSDDEKGLRMMTRMASEILDQPRAMSGMAFQLQSDEWSLWLPPEIHPCYRSFHRMYLQTLSDIYNQQKAVMIESRQGTTGPLIASLNRIKKQDSDEIATYCVWKEGVLSLLPKSDYVFFKSAVDTRKPDQARLYGRWDRVTEVVANLISQEPDMYPERFRVEQFPTPVQLASLKCDDRLGHPGAIRE